MITTLTNLLMFICIIIEIPLLIYVIRLLSFLEDKQIIAISEEDLLKECNKELPKES